MNNSAIADQNFSKFRTDCKGLAEQPSHWLVQSRPVVIFGAGQFGRDVCTVLRAQGFEVVGFIESKSRFEPVLGLPVLTWDQLKPEDINNQLVIGVYNRAMPLDELERIGRAARFDDIFMPWDIFSQFEGALGWRYWLSTPGLILANIDLLERAYDSLSDVGSRECMLNICRFRLGSNTSYGSFRHIDNQYFNELTVSEWGERPIQYVDGGAYNGDTFVELTNICNVTSAYLFEPDPANYVRLTKAVATTNVSATCLPLALSNGYEMLSFTAGSGEAGSISKGGAAHVAAVSLDDILHGHTVDFIKLDVEGSEIPALMGAARVIDRCRPTMAISLYHRAQDVWEIPKSLSNLCPDYLFYVRQHWFNSFDSVMYAIPKSIKN